MQDKSSLEQDIRELTDLFPRVLRGFRGSGPPPPALAEAFEQGRLGPRHGPVVMAIALDGPLSVGELATRIGLNPSTTSMLVNELSRAHLLERQEDDADRRRVIVRLPQRYRATMSEWAEQRVLPLRRTLERLDPDTRTHFLAGWRVLDEETQRGRTSVDAVDELVQPTSRAGRAGRARKRVTT